MSGHPDYKIRESNTHYGKHYDGECKKCGWRTMSYAHARSVRAMLNIHLKENHTK